MLNKHLYQKSHKRNFISSKICEKFPGKKSFKSLFLQQVVCEKKKINSYAVHSHNPLESNASKHNSIKIFIFEGEQKKRARERQKKEIEKSIITFLRFFSLKCFSLACFFSKELVLFFRLNRIKGGNVII